MANVADVDVAIVGGGCAGLSLGVHLAEHGDLRGRVAILEARTEYRRDRTWCGWSVAPHAFQGCVDRSWDRWVTRHQGQVVTQRSSALPYEHIRADRFYGSAVKRISASPLVELRLGEAVTEVIEQAGTFEVHAAGTVLRARTVIDTRPPKATPAPDGGLLQHFVGQEVITEDPVFDPRTATLMDFDVDQRHGLHFVYVLPGAERQALVESTVISPEPLPREVYHSRIQDYVQTNLGTEITSVEFEESGVIPMHPIDAEAGTSGVVLAGTLGGAVKPSSGYGFHGIQRQAAALADALVHGRPTPAGPPRSGLDRWLDRVFLGYLERHPERGPEVFQRLFRRVDGGTLARFLMERPTAADRLRVVAAMPKLPFMGQAFRTLHP